MNVITLFSLFACAGALVLSGLVIGRDPSRRLFQVFGLYGVVSAVWSLGFAILYSVTNPAEAILWIRFYEAGLVFLPSVFFHFVVSYIPDNRVTWQKKIVSLGYLLSTVFFVTVWTPYFARSVEKYPWGFYPSVGIASRLFNVMFAIFVVLGFVELLRYFKTTSGFKRNQTKYLLTASLIGFGLGITNFLPLYGFRSVYPLGHFGALLAVVVLSYAIVKHRLMDIDVVVRRSVVYSALTAVLAAAYVCTVFLLGEFFQGLTGYKAWLPTIVFAVIVAVTFEPLHRSIQVTVDRVFFRRSYEQKSVINQAREDLRQMVNPLTISSYLINKIDEILNLSHGWVVTYDKQQSGFQLAAQLAASGSMPFELKLDNSNLVDFMSTRDKPLIVDNDGDALFRRDTDKQDRDCLEKMGIALVAPLKGRASTVGLLLIGNRKSGDGFSSEDIDLVNTLSDYAAASIENASLYDQLQTSYISTVKSLVMALEAKDKYTRGHSERVARYARDIASEMGLLEQECQLLYEVALLHDVGKIGISDRILNKPRKLSSQEYMQVQNHPVVGEKILSAVESLKDGLSTVRHHHERLSGDGYPDGLSESSIPLPARILAVADAYDAMTTSRPYREAMNDMEAINELKRHACSQFDPQVVRAFISVFLRNSIRKNNKRPAKQSAHKSKRHLKTA